MLAFCNITSVKEQVLSTALSVQNQCYSERTDGIFLCVQSKQHVHKYFLDFWSLKFTALDPHRGLCHPDIDWKGNTAALKHEISNLGDYSVHGWQVLGTSNWGANKTMCSPGPDTYKQGRTGQAGDACKQPWVQWPWDCEVQDSKRWEQSKKSRATTLDFNLFEDPPGRVPWDTVLERCVGDVWSRRAGWYSRITSSKFNKDPSQQTSQAKAAESLGREGNSLTGLRHLKKKKKCIRGGGRGRWLGFPDPSDSNSVLLPSPMWNWF